MKVRLIETVSTTTPIVHAIIILSGTTAHSSIVAVASSELWAAGWLWLEWRIVQLCVTRALFMAIMFTKGHGVQELVRFDALYNLFSL